MEPLQMIVGGGSSMDGIRFINKSYSRPPKDYNPFIEPLQDISHGISKRLRQRKQRVYRKNLTRLPTNTITFDGMD